METVYKLIMGLVAIVAISVLIAPVLTKVVPPLGDLVTVVLYLGVGAALFGAFEKGK